MLQIRSMLLGAGLFDLCCEVLCEGYPNFSPKFGEVERNSWKKNVGVRLSRQVLAKHCGILSLASLMAPGP